MKLQKIWQFIIVLSVITPLLGFLLQATSFRPAINIDNAVLSSLRNHISITLLNNGDRINNIKVNIYLLNSENSTCSAINFGEIESMPPLNGRTNKKIHAEFKMPNSVYVCISYDGSYLTDNYWHIYLLDTTKLATIQFDITSYYGHEIKAGHNLFFEPNFGKMIKALTQP